MKLVSNLIVLVAWVFLIAACGGGGGAGNGGVAGNGGGTGNGGDVSPPPPVADYAVLQLDPLPGDHRANANDINGLGEIAGWSSGGTMGQTAVLWSIDQAGVVTAESLGKLPGGTFSSAQAINNNGQVVGFADGASGTRRPFIWTENDGMRDLGVPVGFVGGQAHQINDNGQVVGAVFDAEFSGLPDQGRFAIWTVNADGDVVDTRDLGNLGGGAATAWDNNVHGNVAGDIWPEPRGIKAFFWSEADGVIEIPAPEAFAEALGINDNDEVVGIMVDDEGRNRMAYVWTMSGGFTLVSEVTFVKINNAGQAVGRTRVEPIGLEATEQALIWENGETELLPMPEDRDWSTAWAIDESGWVVGWSTDVDGNDYANLWTPN